MKILASLLLAAAAATVLVLMPARQCTVFDQPGPTIAGVIRIGGCP